MRLGWRWWPVLVAAVLLAAARVLLGLHYPLDVAAGAALGLGAAWAVCALARLPALPAARAAARRGGRSRSLAGAAGPRAQPPR